MVDGWSHFARCEASNIQKYTEKSGRATNDNRLTRTRMQIFFIDVETAPSFAGSARCAGAIE